jgi:hypothetical protein
VWVVEWCSVRGATLVLPEAMPSKDGRKQEISGLPLARIKRIIYFL